MIDRERFGCGRFYNEQETTMSEAGEPKPEEQVNQEQPPDKQQPEATTPEQKPDDGEGETPAEPTPQKTEPAAEEEEETEEEEPEDGVPIVLVTGASGFIATHLIKQLLEQGRYHVRGTVRNKKRQEKVRRVAIYTAMLQISIYIVFILFR